MSLALYHEKWGYYSKNPGTEDYYTNVDVHPIFSEILARFFAETLKKNFAGESVSIVELGPGPGKLAGNILSWIEQNETELFQRLKYVAVEKSAARKSAILEKAKKFQGRLTAQNNLPASVTGVIFSNEFFDALPFERVRMKGGKLKEIWVDENFSEVEQDAREPILKFFEWLGEYPQEGCEAEVPWSSKEWMTKIGRCLRKGIVLTIDYGYEARELFSELRPSGTALCHFRHSTNRDFYQNIGEQDITAHANFSVLIKEGEKWGLSSEKLVSQSRFVLDHGFEDAVRSLEQTQDIKMRLKLSSAIKTLVHPEGMGGTFKALLQKKA